MRPVIEDEKLIDIEILIPDPKNARSHPEKNLRSIRESLKQFGQLESLIVRKQNDVVLGGNARLAVMKELGFKEVKVRYVECDDQQAAAIGLVLNRSGELARWNMNQLQDTLSDLGEMELNWDELGFTDQDFSFLKTYDDKPLNNVIEGATELDENDFDKFAHQCPKCGFEFN